MAESLICASRHATEIITVRDYRAVLHVTSELSVSDAQKIVLNIRNISSCAVQRAAAIDSEAVLCLQLQAQHVELPLVRGARLVALQGARRPEHLVTHHALVHLQHRRTAKYCTSCT